MKYINTFKVGLGISLVSWIISWIILSIKLDTLTLIGFVLYGLGLSGLIIYLFVPKIVLIFLNSKEKETQVS